MHSSKATPAKPTVALERAIKPATFPRFLELPAELRNNIYEHAVADHKTQALTRPQQPAICRASRQLRHESLGLFYFTQTFVISTVGTPQKGGRTIVDKDRAWLESIGSRNRGHIRSVMLARFQDEIHYRVPVVLLPIRVVRVEWTEDGLEVSMTHVGDFTRDESVYGGMKRASVQPTAEQLLPLEKRKDAIQRALVELKEGCRLDRVLEIAN